MIIEDYPESTDEVTGGLTPQHVSDGAVLDTLFDLFQDDRTVVVELAGDHTIVRCNRGYADACGTTPERLPGTAPPDLFTVHVLGKSVQSGGTRAVPKEYPFAAQEEWLCRHGMHCTVNWLTLWTHHGPEGTRYVKLGWYRDHNRNDGQDDSQSRLQLQSFIEGSPDAIITIDDQGTMVSVNPATRDLFGYNQTELLGHNVSLLMPSPDRERHDGYLARYLETGDPRIIGIGREIVARRKDGSTFPARLSVSEFKAHGASFFTGVLHDISERVEAEEKNREMFAEHAHASRVVALGEMASSIAHEINQPLTAIVSYADASRKLVESDRLDTDTVKRALREISAQGQRAGQIIRRLREFVRKKEPKRSSVNMNDLIESAVALTAHDADRYGITLTFDLERQRLDAMVDRLQIEQVLLNLIRNSIESVNDAARNSGEIRIGSRLEDGAIHVTVSDNGAGIAASELSSIFEPFFTTKEKGTGLGLSISRSIAQAHGGELSCRPNPDAGATFVLEFPTGIDD